MELMDVTGASRRQEMLTQGSAPDPKCKLNISFLTLQRLLDCLIYVKDIMVIVLLLQMIEEWEAWGVIHLFQGFDRE